MSPASPSATVNTDSPAATASPIGSPTSPVSSPISTRQSTPVFPITERRKRGRPRKIIDLSSPDPKSKKRAKPRPSFGRRNSPAPKGSSRNNATEPDPVNLESVMSWQKELKIRSDDEKTLLKEHYSKMFQIAGEHEFIKEDSRFNDNYHRIYTFLSKLFSPDFDPEADHELEADDWKVLDFFIEDMQLAVKKKILYRQKAHLIEKGKKFKEGTLNSRVTNPLAIPRSILHPLRYLNGVKKYPKPINPRPPHHGNNTKNRPIVLQLDPNSSGNNSNMTNSRNQMIAMRTTNSLHPVSTTFNSARRASTISNTDSINMNFQTLEEPPQNDDYLHCPPYSDPMPAHNYVGDYLNHHDGPHFMSNMINSAHQLKGFNRDAQMDEEVHLQVFNHRHFEQPAVLASLNHFEESHPNRENGTIDTEQMSE